MYKFMVLNIFRTIMVEVEIQFLNILPINMCENMNIYIYFLTIIVESIVSKFLYRMI